MGQRSILITIVLVIFVLIFSVLFVLSRLTPRTEQEAKKPQVVAKTTVAAVDVISDPLVYDGLTIEVEAGVTDWVTKRSFTVSAGGGGLLGGGGQLIVISKTPFKLPKDTKEKELGLGETVNVSMKGKARIMDRVELGRALGLDLDGSDIELDDNNIAQWTEGSVLLLETVEKL